MQNRKSIKKQFTGNRHDYHDDETSGEIVRWIEENGFQQKTINMKLMSFEPVLFSDENCLKLLKCGLNPKFNLYTWTEEDRTANHKDWSNPLGSKYDEQPDDFWFCPRDIISKKAFHFVYGQRVPKNENIGKDRFGIVFKTAIHNTAKAVKFLDVTEIYKEKVMKNYRTVSATYDATYEVSKMFQSTAHEAAAYLYGKLRHENILQLDEFWLQMSNLSKIELCLASKLCDCNLSEWIQNEPYNLYQLKSFVIQMSRALHYLSINGLVHRDMKRSNVLITDQDHPVAKLSDFGLSNPEINGLTPGYCAPEQVSPNVSGDGQKFHEKTDMYGLGITAMLTLFQGQDGMAMIFLPSKEIPTEVARELDNNEFVRLIRKMIKYEPEKRCSFETVESSLENAYPVLYSSIIKKWLQTEVPKLAKEYDFGKMGDDLAKVAVIDKKLPDLAPSKRFSVESRKQFESKFCWALAIAKILLAELRQFIQKLEQEGVIDSLTKKDAFGLAETINVHHWLVYEIICLVSPRNPNSLKSVLTMTSFL